MPLGGEQRRQPVGEAIESDGLAEVEDDQHHGARAVRRLPEVGERPLTADLDDTDLWRSERTPEFGFDIRLERSENSFRRFEVAPLGQPSWRFRQPPAEPPDRNRASAADQHEPAPPGDTQGIDGYEQIGQEGKQRD